jgi:hypothetical protein
MKNLIFILLFMFLGQSCNPKPVCDIYSGGLTLYIWWTSSCLIKKDKDGVSVGEIRKSISFHNNNFEFEVVHYKPNTFSGCQSGYESFLSWESGTFVKNEGSLSLHSDRFRELPLSEEAVAFKNNTNNNSHCGMSDWELNREKDITGLECSGKKMDPYDQTFKFEEFENYLLIDDERFDLQKSERSGLTSC